jgi:hypothetical protein
MRIEHGYILLSAIDMFITFVECGTNGVDDVIPDQLIVHTSGRNLKYRTVRVGLSKTIMSNSLIRHWLRD